MFLKIYRERRKASNALTVDELTDRLTFRASLAPCNAEIFCRSNYILVAFTFSAFVISKRHLMQYMLTNYRNAQTPLMLKKWMLYLIQTADYYIKLSRIFWRGGGGVEGEWGSIVLFPAYHLYDTKICYHIKLNTGKHTIQLYNIQRFTFKLSNAIQHC